MYQMVAGDGRVRTPYVVRREQTPLPPSPSTVAFDLTPDQLEGLRAALIAVVEEGTARGSRVRNLVIAGKTATSQNPHGPDHGWFIGFAPATKPEIVVGAIIEFAQHGSAVAPFVSRVIAHYLGADSAAAGIRLVLPADTAPQAQHLLPDPESDSTPTDTVRGVPAPRDR